ncbi:MAG: hypothetical protein KJ607_13165 [Bacteroidetes bacterium]|nr:hypothetical protein [Bacteroidota bacterium]
MNKFGFNITEIKKIISGTKYSAVLLKNGNIGVCANLMNSIDPVNEDLKSPDLSNTCHRIILNAYYNGLLNYSNTFNKTGDIFDEIDFKKYENIIMIGLFKPLLKKFKENNIRVSIFDKIKEHHEIISMDAKSDYIRKADAIVLSSTTVFNNTFMNIINSSGEKCDIFMLGPSSIMDNDMFLYKNIKGIFGSVFNRNDEAVLETIEKGYGTQDFIKFGEKISLLLMTQMSK